jgi:hypothetical protein
MLRSYSDRTAIVQRSYSDRTAIVHGSYTDPLTPRCIYRVEGTGRNARASVYFKSPPEYSSESAYLLERASRRSIMIHAQGVRGKKVRGAAGGRGKGRRIGPGPPSGYRLRWLGWGGKSLAEKGKAPSCGGGRSGVGGGGGGGGGGSGGVYDGDGDGDDDDDDDDDDGDDDDDDDDDDD